MHYELLAELALGPQDVDDPYTRIKLLTRALTEDADTTGARQQHGKIVHGEIKQDPRNRTLAVVEIQDSYAQLIRTELGRLRDLGLAAPTPPELGQLPSGSLFLQCTFRLAKPYLSRDDEPLYIVDNPLRKDKVFKVPFISATGWKGLLRGTMMLTLAEEAADLHEHVFVEQRLQLTRLFGNEKEVELADEEEERWQSFLDARKPRARGRYREFLREATRTGFRTGRLQCYPTFFDRMDLEVLNPHGRATRAGTQPLVFECVPIGARGTFSLLYVPFDLAGEDREVWLSDLKADLPLLAEAISRLLLRYGFSAKRTSGFGLAEDVVQGTIWAYGGTTPVTKLSNLKEVMTRAIAY